MLSIFELYSRLFNLSFPRKKFGCVSSKGKLFALNTSANTFITLIFTLFSCGLLFSGFIEAFVNKSEISIEFIIAFSILFIIGLLGLRHFLWLINGRQELTIENGELILIKKGTFLTKPKTYSFDLVTNVRSAINDDNLSLIDKIQQNISLNRKVFFRQILGQILFDYNGKTIRVFNDMNSKERSELIIEIMKLKSSRNIISQS